MDNTSLKKFVFDYKTKYEQGFTTEELKNIVQDIIKKVPAFNVEKMEEAFYGNTCMFIEGNVITYHVDVINALKCGIENRNLKTNEWD